MEDEFIVTLSYQAQVFNVEIEDPTKSIEEIVKKIIVGLELPRTDGGGNPLTYLLGRILDDQEEILKPTMNDKIQTLADYQIKPGDSLTLTFMPIAG